MKKTIIFLFISSFFLVGCNGLLDVDSERLIYPDEYNFSSESDTLYSMIGVFSKMEKLVNSYVVDGELRGDLMSLSNNANLNLKEIYNFSVSDSNEYARAKDYYAVINNCNYIINRLDTSVVEGNKQVLLKEYVACKSIRAWTYLQLAINFGSVKYYEKPILTADDVTAVGNTADITLEELTPLLIADLLPYKDRKDIELPYIGSLSSYNMRYSFFPIKFVLGDLFLWSGQYENAAQTYYDLIDENSYLVYSAFTSSNKVINNAFSSSYYINWLNIFEPSTSGAAEYITQMATTNEFGIQFQLDSLTQNRTLYPSEIALNNWSTQRYYYNSTLDTVGDLRKIGSVSTTPNALGVYFKDISQGAEPDYYIYKYLLLNDVDEAYAKDAKQIIIYRVELLYLRYAEALNRMGKPATALAILKNGLNSTNMSNSYIIPHNEMIMNISEKTIKSVIDPTQDSIKYDTTYTAPNYMDFTNHKYANNVGLRMRGLGNADKDSMYIIPQLDTKIDTILFVEDKIQEELALETAFEGNRFQDLMRFAIRRNDNAYLADKVSAKYVNRIAMREKLMDRKNWYLK